MPETPTTPVSALPNRDLKTLWFTLRRARAWRALALVSADGAPVGRLAHQLAQMAALTPKRHVLVLDAVPRTAGEAVLPPLGHYGVKAMREDMTESEMLGAFVPEATQTLANTALDVVLLAAPTPVVHAHAIPLIASADAVVMCVKIGESHFMRARETLQNLDRDRLLGAVLIGGD